MKGEVGTQASPVSGQRMLRRQPRIGTTVSLPAWRFASGIFRMSGASLAIRASSPIVSPWTYGTRNSPT